MNVGFVLIATIIHFQKSLYPIALFLSESVADNQSKHKEKHTHFLKTRRHRHHRGIVIVQRLCGLVPDRVAARDGKFRLCRGGAQPRLGAFSPDRLRWLVSLAGGVLCGLCQDARHGRRTGRRGFFIRLGGLFTAGLQGHLGAVSLPRHRPLSRNRLSVARRHHQKRSGGVGV